jgi:uncharacterized protein (DUF488 family)
MDRSKNSPVVYSVGHSNHSGETFIALLNRVGITAIADVRSMPFSRFAPHFNQANLKYFLKEAGIAYSFLGDELGARPKDRTCYRNGTANYDLIAATEAFSAGLERVIKGAEKYTIALMCAEKDPLDCHRNILVARHLAKRGVVIKHVLADGQVEENSVTEGRLLKLTGEDKNDLFVSHGEAPIDRAYTKRSEAIAYTESTNQVDKSATS